MSEEKLCPEPAVFRYTWAGQEESLCCVHHGKALRVVANAIGYQFQLLPLSEADTMCGLTCLHPNDLPEKVSDE